MLNLLPPDCSLLPCILCDGQSYSHDHFGETFCAAERIDQSIWGPVNRLTRAIYSEPAAATLADFYPDANMLERRAIETSLIACAVAIDSSVLLPECRPTVINCTHILSTFLPPCTERLSCVTSCSVAMLKERTRRSYHRRNSEAQTQEERLPKLGWILCPESLAALERAGRHRILHS